MPGISILSDAPVSSNRDLLAFDRYIEPIIEILSSDYTETPFTIGVFGTWGSGKSTLLKMLDEQLEKSYTGRFVRVHFNPWIHRREDNILLPLLHTLQDALVADKTSRFVESAHKIGDVLLRLGADVLLKRLTADAASLDRIEDLEKKYLERQGRVTSETRKLRQTLQKEADEISRNGAKLIFFIDDLDRCEPDEIIALLEAVKLFLDLQNVFVILALDKEVIDRGIEVKYHDFGFDKDRKFALGAEYIEKMIQLPLQLYPLRKEQVRRFIEACGPSEEILSRIALLETIILPNPRKIKRILNILSVSSNIASHTSGLENLDRNILARLAVLQVQASDLYWQIVRMPEALFAFSGLAATPPAFNLATPGSFTRFGAQRSAVVELCTRFYQPGTFLSALFSGDPATGSDGVVTRPGAFDKLDPSKDGVDAGKLPVYLSMLGA